MAVAFSCNVYEINGIPRPAVSFAFVAAQVKDFTPYTGNNSALYGVITTSDNFNYATVETVAALKTLANA
jgi:hypothetical protein